MRKRNDFYTKYLNLKDFKEDYEDFKELTNLKDFIEHN
jgi:hypothetical protein